MTIVLNNFSKSINERVLSYPDRLLLALTYVGNGQFGWNVEVDKRADPTERFTFNTLGGGYIYNRVASDIKRRAKDDETLAVYADNVSYAMFANAAKDVYESMPDKEKPTVEEIREHRDMMGQRFVEMVHNAVKTGQRWVTMPVRMAIVNNDVRGVMTHHYNPYPTQKIVDAIREAKLANKVVTAFSDGVSDTIYIRISERGNQYKFRYVLIVVNGFTGHVALSYSASIVSDHFKFDHKLTKRNRHMGWLNDTSDKIGELVDTISQYQPLERLHVMTGTNFAYDMREYINSLGEIGDGKRDKFEAIMKSAYEFIRENDDTTALDVIGHLTKKHSKNRGYGNKLNKMIDFVVGRIFDDEFGKDEA